MGVPGRQYSEAEQQRFRRRVHLVLVGAMLCAIAASVASILYRGPQL
jgi:hypothetical protein